VRSGKTIFLKPSMVLGSGPAFLGGSQFGAKQYFAKGTRIAQPSYGCGMR